MAIKILNGAFASVCSLLIVANALIQFDRNALFKFWVSGPYCGSVHWFCDGTVGMGGARNLKLVGQRQGGARARAQKGNIFVCEQNIGLYSVVACVEKM